MFSRKEMRDSERFLKSDQRGVRDEIGFLLIHQGLADRFFPGTSVLHTRVRYVHFIPWVYEDAAKRRGRGNDLRTAVNNRLRDLTGRLKRVPQWGVIGGDIFPRQPAQPADTIYWSALRTWKILHPELASRALALQRLYEGGKQALLDDDGGLLEDDLTEVFQELPKRPENWDKDDSGLLFTMLLDERKRLKKKLGKVMRPGSHQGSPELSLLATLMQSESTFEHAASELPKELANFADAEDRKALQIARDAAGLAAIGRTVYGALVEMLREKDGISNDKKYRIQLSAWFDEYGESAGRCDLNGLEKLVPEIPTLLRKLLSDTQEYVVNGKPEKFADLLKDYGEVEWNRKGLRARLKSHAHTTERRKEWVPDQHNTDPLHYRWYVVRTMLGDLNG